MDKDILVSEGQKLVALLDTTSVAPRGAMWVYGSDSDTWKLWLVPPDGIKKEEFYRIVAQSINDHDTELPSLNIGLVEMKGRDHPAVRGLSSFIRMDGLGAATFSNNRFNGFFLPDGVVLRMAI